jgi:glyoxylase-like metal-dependent hydrolase (beta-lactamase superfamily II)
MTKRTASLVALLTALSVPAAAQDGTAVIAAAAKAMGADTLTGISYYGAGATFNLGQSNNANGAWPRSNVSDYVRSIDFTQPASRATGVTFVAPVTGGPAVQGQFQQNVTPANTAWAQQLEIWLTPWGFLKGAAANNGSAAPQVVGTRPYNVVTWMTPQKSPSGNSYKVVGYINNRNLVERVQTWLENPIFGDMLVEAIYTEYRDANGVKYPSAIVQKRGGQAVFEAQILGIRANPSNIAELVTSPAGGGRGGPGGQGGGPPAAAAAGPSSEKLADGVYRINGAYNALAIEFKDHIVLFEGGPQSEARSLAIIAEAKKVIPGKPIRYSILTHHHFDHSSGLPAIVAEGATIITHDVNKNFLLKALSAPRTLAPDVMSKSGKRPKIESVIEKRVLQDETRTVEIHHIIGLPHADGMLMVYLPKEKIAAYADMFNLPPADNPVPNPPVVGTQVFLANLERLNIEPERIMSVHSLNPDRLATKADITKSLGR